MKTNKASAGTAAKGVAKDGMDTQKVTRQAILVLGMHRSGTSALSGVLAKLGAAAPKSPMPGNEYNERGYWESHALAVLHDRILQSAGSRWNDWTRFNPAWADSPTAAEFEAQLQDLIVGEYGDKPLFVVKDPRVSRFVPLWLRVLGRLDVTAKVVVPIRDPEEVVQSLARRDRFGRCRSRLLWLRHVLDAEASTRGLQRTFLRYEDLLADWKGQMLRVGKDLGIAWPRWSAEAEVEVEQFLSAELRHHHGSAGNGAEFGELEQWSAETHRILSGFALGERQNAPAFATLDGILHDLDRTARIYGPVVREHEVSADQLHAHAKRQLEERLKEEAGRAGLLEAALAAMEKRALRAEDDAKSRAGRLLVLQNENEKHQSRILEQTERHVEREVDLQVKITMLQAEADRLAPFERALAEMEQRAVRAETDARNRAGRLQLQDEELKAQATLRTELQERIDSLEGRGLELEQQLSVARTQLSSLQVEKSRLSESLEERFRELAAFARAMEATSQRLEKASVALGHEQNRAAVAERRCRQVQQELAQRRRECDQMAGRMKGQEVELQALASQLETASMALKSTRVDLDRILASNTWRLGRPLRVLRRLISGVPLRGLPAPPDDASRIRNSGVFDEAWYLARYPDVAASGDDPIEHYLTHGCDEGRDPSPVFSTSGYYRAHPDLIGTQNALLHFLDERS